MSEDVLRYDQMVETALRGVLKQALTVVLAQGLPGDHHFYITFRTRFPGTQIPKFMLARHPDEMTIVLQHQFWDLRVNDDSFEVTLSFNQVPEHCIVPFAAVTAFADPSAKFGLQFQIEGEGSDGEGDDFDGEEFEGGEFDGELEEDHEGEDKADRTPPPVEERGQVIALDAFRKK